MLALGSGKSVDRALHSLPQDGKLGLTSSRPTKKTVNALRVLQLPLQAWARKLKGNVKQIDVRAPDKRP